MSVFKRNGAGKYSIQFNYNGKIYRRSSKTAKKRTAERIEREWRDGEPGSQIPATNSPLIQSQGGSISV